MSENKSDFTQRSIVSKLLRFMVPILGALVLQAMYGAVDILIVGRFGTTAGISDVSTGSSIVNLVTFTITGLTMGVTVVMGQYFGEKKPDKVGEVVGGAIWLFLVLAFFIAAAMLIFARPLAVLMQALPDSTSVPGAVPWSKIPAVSPAPIQCTQHIAMLCGWHPFAGMEGTQNRTIPHLRPARSIRQTSEALPW